jgi:hypothetical protein
VPTEPHPTRQLAWNTLGIAGQVVGARAVMLGTLGELIDTGWGTLSARGADLGDELAYPSRDDMLRVPGNQRGFFALHDSYHVGQRALLRKALGHASLVG